MITEVFYKSPLTPVYSKFVKPCLFYILRYIVQQLVRYDSFSGTLKETLHMPYVTIVTHVSVKLPH